MTPAHKNVQETQQEEDFRKYEIGTPDHLQSFLKTVPLESLYASLEKVDEDDDAFNIVKAEIVEREKISSENEVKTLSDNFMHRGFRGMMWFLIGFGLIIAMISSDDLSLLEAQASMDLWKIDLWSFVSTSLSIFGVSLALVALYTLIRLLVTRQSWSWILRLLFIILPLAGFAMVGWGGILSSLSILDMEDPKDPKATYHQKIIEAEKKARKDAEKAYNDDPEPLIRAASVHAKEEIQAEGQKMIMMGIMCLLPCIFLFFAYRRRHIFHLSSIFHRLMRPLLLFFVPIFLSIRFLLYFAFLSDHLTGGSIIGFIILSSLSFLLAATISRSVSINYFRTKGSLKPKILG